MTVTGRMAYHSAQPPWLIINAGRYLTITGNGSRDQGGTETAPQLPQQNQMPALKNDVGDSVAGFIRPELGPNGLPNPV